jgi:hypothetical protein
VGVGRVIDWAYEDSCDTPIIAGAGAPIAPISVPTLGELGMLIMTGNAWATKHRLRSLLLLLHFDLECGDHIISDFDKIEQNISSTWKINYI